MKAVERAPINLNEDLQGQPIDDQAEPLPPGVLSISAPVQTREGFLAKEFPEETVGHLHI